MKRPAWPFIIIDELNLTMYSFLLAKTINFGAIYLVNIDTRMSFLWPMQERNSPE
ncbi:hypothetical protein [Thalassotalea piscium]|uniref:Uncharacterized protein n=1 Tax=Thalassotalea piscium TaxID=1230533 RepID=A0A7X0TU35_9GAMM|nr:hypothetical protein [Thalassotalea piscium]MBB6543675.1 hypothetical protein [Thalassotalea piscium]